MDEKEKVRAQSEALKGTAVTRGERLGFWSALTRYLGASARHEQAARQADESRQPREGPAPRR